VADIVGKDRGKKMGSPFLIFLKLSPLPPPNYAYYTGWHDRETEHISTKWFVK